MLEITQFLYRLQEMAATMATTLLPRVGNGAIVLLFGWLVASIARKLTVLGLRAVGADVFFGRLGGDRLMNEGRIRRKPSQIGGLLAYGFVWVTAILATLDVLGLDAASTLLNDLLAYLPRLVVALVMLGVGAYLVDFVVGIAQDLSILRQQSWAPLVTWSIRTGLMLLVLIAVADQLGVATSFLMIGFAATAGGLALTVVVAFGWGGRELVCRYLAGVALRRHLQCGDSIQFAGQTARIECVGLFATELSVAEGVLVVDSNLLLTEGVIKIKA